MDMYPRDDGMRGPDLGDRAARAMKQLQRSHRQSPWNSCTIQPVYTIKQSRTTVFRGRDRFFVFQPGQVIQSLQAKALSAAEALGQPSDHGLTRLQTFLRLQRGYEQIWIELSRAIRI